MELICTFSIPTYTHEDFADEEFEDIAYYGDEGELVKVRAITDEDIYKLWLAKGEDTDGWDGELIGYKVMR